MPRESNSVHVNVQVSSDRFKSRTNISGKERKSETSEETLTREHQVQKTFLVRCHNSIDADTVAIARFSRDSTYSEIVSEIASLFPPTGRPCACHIHYRLTLKWYNCGLIPRERTEITRDNVRDVLEMLKTGKGRDGICFERLYSVGGRQMEEWEHEDHFGRYERRERWEQARPRWYENMRL